MNTVVHTSTHLGYIGTKSALIGKPQEGFEGGGGVLKSPGWRLEDWQMEGLYIGLSVQKQVRQERG